MRSRGNSGGLSNLPIVSISDCSTDFPEIPAMKKLALLSLAAALLLPAAILPAYAGDALTAGTPAPGFTLPSQDNTPISLNDYKGKWVVLYFYPKDMTKGCTLEAHNFQRDLDKYKTANAVVLGV